MNKDFYRIICAYSIICIFSMSSLSAQSVPELDNSFSFTTTDLSDADIARIDSGECDYIRTSDETIYGTDNICYT